MSPAVYENDAVLVENIGLQREKSVLPSAYVQMTTNQYLIDYIDDVPRLSSSPMSSSVSFQVVFVFMFQNVYIMLELGFFNFLNVL